MPGGFCPDCDGKIDLSPIKMGQLMTCPHCDAQLEVIGEDPLEFDWAYDWAWEDEDEHDDEVEGEDDDAD